MVHPRSLDGIYETVASKEEKKSLSLKVSIPVNATSHKLYECCKAGSFSCLDIVVQAH